MDRYKASGPIDNEALNEAIDGEYVRYSDILVRHSLLETLLTEYRTCAISAAIELINGHIGEYMKHNDKELRIKSKILTLYM